jgi:CRP-like cAMP-binding protein
MLLTGSFEVWREKRRIVELDACGTVVGEVAFFTQGGRMSDVVVGSGGARVLALSDRTLRELIMSHGPVAAKFLYYVAQGLCNKLRIEAATHQ